MSGSDEDKTHTKNSPKKRNVESNDSDQNLDKKPSAAELPPEFFESENYAKRARAIKHEKRHSIKKKLKLYMKICAKNMTTSCCLIRKKKETSRVTTYRDARSFYSRRYVFLPHCAIFSDSRCSF